MKQFTLLCITSILLLQSCSNKRISVIGMDYTDTCRITVMDTLPVILEDYGFGLFHTKMGYIAGKEEDNNYIQLWDSKTGKKIFGFGSIGRGPNEFLMPFCTDVNYEKNIIYIIDIITQKMSSYLLGNDTLQLLKTFDVPMMTGGSLINFIDDSTYVYRSFDGKVPKLILYNINKGIICEYVDDILNESSFNNISSIYQSSIQVAPNKNKIILRCGSLNSISCFSIENNSLKLDWRKFLIDPIYHINNNELILDQEKMERGLLKDCMITNSYIYLLVYDAKQEDTPVTDFENPLYKLEHSYIIRMNFEGDVLNTYKINCAPLYMAQSPNDNTITVLINHPNYHLLKFDL